MFPRKEELLRNMMGLLGNVAEMKSLRPFLMTDRFVSVFADLLGSCCDGIEVRHYIVHELSFDTSVIFTLHVFSPLNF